MVYIISRRPLFGHGSGLPSPRVRLFSPYLCFWVLGSSFPDALTTAASNNLQTRRTEMAHLRHILSEPELDYSVLFDIDQIWTWKDFVSAAWNTPGRLVELLQSTPDFVQLVWSRALELLVEFLAAIDQNSGAVDRGISCAFWPLWKGVAYPLVYLVLVRMYIIVWGLSVLLWWAMGGKQDGE